MFDQFVPWLCSIKFNFCCIMGLYEIIRINHTRPTEQTLNKCANSLACKSLLWRYLDRMRHEFSVSILFIILRHYARILRRKIFIIQTIILAFSCNRMPFKIPCSITDVNKAHVDLFKENRFITHLYCFTQNCVTYCIYNHLIIPYTLQC